MSKRVYQLVVRLPKNYQRPSYNLKYSDEGSNIGISIPGFRVDVSKTAMNLPTDFQSTLKRNGFSDVAIQALNLFFFVGNPFHVGVTSINARTGHFMK